VTRPVKELKGFEKMLLKKGETRTIRFTLTDADLAFTRADMSWGSESGDYKLWIGPSSAEGAEAAFALTE
jgi:beta-glucosidase